MNLTKEIQSLNNARQICYFLLLWYLLSTYVVTIVIPPICGVSNFAWPYPLWFGQLVFFGFSVSMIGLWGYACIGLIRKTIAVISLQHWALIVCGVILLIWSLMTGRTFTTCKYVILALSILFIPLATSFALTGRDVRRFVVDLNFLIFVPLFLNVVLVLKSAGYDYYERFHGVYLGPNEAAEVFLVLFLLALAGTVKGVDSKFAWVNLFSSSLLLFLTHSRGSLVCLAIALLIYFIRYPFDWRNLGIFSALIVGKILSGKILAVKILLCTSVMPVPPVDATHIPTQLVPPVDATHIPTQPVPPVDATHIATQPVSTADVAGIPAESTIPDVVIGNQSPCLNERHEGKIITQNLDAYMEDRQQVLTKRTSLSEIIESLTTKPDSRFNIWKYYFARINQHPFLGNGVEVVKDTVQSAAGADEATQLRFLSTHNSFIKFLVMCGYPAGGYICLLLLYGYGSFLFQKHSYSSEFAQSRYVFSLVMLSFLIIGMNVDSIFEVVKPNFYLSLVLLGALTVPENPSN